MTEIRPGRIVVLDIVGLQRDHLGSGHTPNITGFLESKVTADLRPPFPAVTVPVQQTMATGQSPEIHGDVANGVYERESDTVTLWGRKQENRKPLWETASEAGLTTGVLFFQHIKGTGADVAVTPSPIEDEDNNMLEMNCWTNPTEFYDELVGEYRHFPLHRYWGPGANEQSSEWILTAARESIERYDPDLLWVYIPHLDYDGQRHGPESPEFTTSLETIDELVGSFLDTLRATERWNETAVNVVSEYAFHAVDTPVFPNRALRDAGLLSVTPDGGKDVDLSASAAFALTDHQVAHVYADSDSISAARECLDGLEGVAEVLDEQGKQTAGIGHSSAGDLVLVAETNAWFQYYWWRDDSDAPEYAADIDIHKKPGYDPCELFLGESGMASLDPSQVQGSHGRVDDGTCGVYGFGGPATPDWEFEDKVPAEAVSPNIRTLFGLSQSSKTAADPTANGVSRDEQ